MSEKYTVTETEVVSSQISKRFTIELPNGEIVMAYRTEFFDDHNDDVNYGLDTDDEDTADLLAEMTEEEIDALEDFISELR